MKFPAAIATIDSEIRRREAAGRTGTIADFEFEPLPDARVRVVVIFADKDRFDFFFDEMTSMLRARLAAMPTVGPMQ